MRRNQGQNKLTFKPRRASQVRLRGTKRRTTRTIYPEPGISF